MVNEMIHFLSAMLFGSMVSFMILEIQLNVKTSDTTTYRIMSTGGVALKMDKASDARINVSDLPSGLYILQIQDADVSKSTKFYKY